jgi:hypothetical protein
MEKHLDAYIKVYDAIPKDLCDTTLALLQNTEITWEPHKFYSNETGAFKANDEPKAVDISFCAMPTNEALMNIVWSCIGNYIEDLKFEWFGSWAGFSEIRFNRYSENQLLAKHYDHITSMFEGKHRGVPLLSIVGVLNDDYEGGEFVMFDDTVVELPQGSVLIFPSTFLYPHTVRPVTKGTRNTFVSWAW